MKIIGPNGLVMDLDPKIARGLLAKRDAVFRLADAVPAVEESPAVAPPQPRKPRKKSPVEVTADAAVGES